MEKSCWKLSESKYNQAEQLLIVGRQTSGGIKYHERKPPYQKSPQDIKKKTEVFVPQLE